MTERDVHVQTRPLRAVDLRRADRQRMTSGDAAWLRMDRPVNTMVVTSVLWFDEALDWPQVRDVLARRLVGRFPRFGQVVVEDGASVWWADDPDLDLERHLQQVTLPAPGNHDALTGYVSTLTTQPLPRDRPLWQMYLVDGLNGRGCAIVARIHHCLADGMALFRVLLSLTDASEEDRQALPTRPDAAGGRSGVVRAAAGIRQAARAARALTGLIGLPPDSRTALRGPLGVAKSVAWSAPIPVDVLHRAARAADATINDLVLAALAGAVRRHLQAAGGKVRDVRAVLPVNLRPPSVTIPVELGNLFGLVFLRLPVTVDDPAQRIVLVQRRTAALKRSLSAFVALHVLAVIGRLPYRGVQLVVEVFSMKGTAVVTNVRGPDEPVHLVDTRVAGLIAWPPQTGRLGIGVSVISYAGNVVIGVMADDQLVGDVGRLLGDTCAEFAALGVVDP